MRHKHTWGLPKFVGDPFNCSWSCRVEECCSCGKTRGHAASAAEIEERIKNLLCPYCGLPNDQHAGTSPGREPLACIKPLSIRIEDLENRLKSLENWRNG